MDEVFLSNNTRKKGKKSEVVHVHAMKAYKESRGRAPLILNPGTRWR
jgi:hypothetical protein